MIVIFIVLQIDVCINVRKVDLYLKFLGFTIIKSLKLHIFSFLFCHLFCCMEKKNKNCKCLIIFKINYLTINKNVLISKN